MAETKSSVHGKQHKKYVTVRKFTTKSGTTVGPYDRSVPRPKTKKKVW